MADNPEIPADAPPPYTPRTRPGNGAPPTRNGISAEARRSMEDERRPLPPGWERQYDTERHHHFYVDTRKEPYRAIWQHPFDDEQYQKEMKPEDRKKASSSLKVPDRTDLDESTDEEGDSRQHGHGASSSSSSNAQQAGEKPSVGRRLKDKLTGTTHEEREKRRRQRDEEERRYYEQHQRLRTAMARAMQTGQPQLVGKDSQGHDLYVEPPSGYGGNYGYPGSASRYNPYTSGVYNQPNARFLRPSAPYGRPYYGGYGGGLGVPLAGGLAGGLLLGGLLGGGL